MPIIAAQVQCVHGGVIVQGYSIDTGMYTCELLLFLCVYNVYYYFEMIFFDVNITL